MLTCVETYAKPYFYSCLGTVIFINPCLYFVHASLDTKNHERKHKDQVEESFLNPKKTHSKTNMQKQTNQVHGKTQERSTVDEYIEKRITHALSADRVIEIKPVSENTYFVAYDYCEQGWCYYVESYVTLSDRVIREKIIRMM